MPKHIKTSWIDGETEVNAKNLNNIEDSVEAICGELGEEVMDTKAQTIKAAINEVFQRGVDVKERVVAAVNAKGQFVTTEDSWDIVIDSIWNIVTEVTQAKTMVVQAINSRGFMASIEEPWPKVTSYIYDISGTPQTPIPMFEETIKPLRLVRSAPRVAVIGSISENIASSLCNSGVSVDETVSVIRLSKSLPKQVRFSRPLTDTVGVAI